MHLGKPVVYKVTKNFMKMFGISSLDDLPELPRYKLDENEQIVIEDVLVENEEVKEYENTNEILEKNKNDVQSENLENGKQISNNESVNIDLDKKEEKDIEAPMPV